MDEPRNGTIKVPEFVRWTAWFIRDIGFPIFVATVSILVIVAMLLGWVTSPIEAIRDNGQAIAALRVEAGQEVLQLKTMVRLLRRLCHQTATTVYAREACDQA